MAIPASNTKTYSDAYEDIPLEIITKANKTSEKTNSVVIKILYQFAKAAIFAGLISFTVSAVIPGIIMISIGAIYAVLAKLKLNHLFIEQKRPNKETVNEILDLSKTNTQTIINSDKALAKDSNTF